MAKAADTLTMDELITGLDDIWANIEGEGQDICQAAVNILFALKEEGAQTTADALDILHEYRLQSKQYASLQKKHLTAGKPFLKDGVWHCPDCNGRCRHNNSFCHRCGKRLLWA